MTAIRRLSIILITFALCLLCAPLVSAQTDSEDHTEILAEPLALTIHANPPIAVAGDDVTFTITAHNTSDMAYINFTIVDILPDQFRITGTDAGENGDLIVNGQQVTWRGGTFNPGDSITVTVDASILMSASLLINRICAGGENLAGICTETNVLGVTTLPRTGETPVWRMLFAVGTFMTLFGALGIIVMLLFPMKPTRAESYRYLRH